MRKPQKLYADSADFAFYRSVEMSYYTLKSGEKLYYEDTGSGSDTVIMLHGWTSSHFIYSEPASVLQDKARCIIYDHRGHGKSKSANKSEASMETLAKDLHELICGLELNNVTLVGWSMGAGTILNYVRIFGCERLKQIVLCDMTPKQINDDDWKLGLYKGEYTQQDRENDEKMSSFSQYRKFILATAPSLSKLPRFIVGRQLLSRLMKCDIAVIRKLAESMKDQDSRDVVGEITVPFTYFYPDPGSIFSPKLEKWYRDNIKTEYRSVKFPDSTHLLIAEHPKMFANELAKLLG